MAKTRKIKKDFDKEKMYMKIMPSMVLADKPPPAGRGPDGGEPPAEEAACALHNYMEDIVRDKLPHTMKVLGACGCERCRMDILAVALNQLPPAYAVAGQEDQPRYLKKLRGAYEVKATASLIRAIQTVKTNPRH